jgi:FtsP/CotA-like multicopper oxidase with cupredoxin domain
MPRLTTTTLSAVLLAALAVTAGAVALTAPGRTALGAPDTPTAAAAEPAFVNPLRIPELLEGERGDDGVVRFELDVEAGLTQFRDGPATETWGINGTYLGPTLRATEGDAVEIAVHNGVDEATTMHWHGMKLPPAMDGGPYQAIGPEDTWHAAWTVEQPAATLWYHPHPHGATSAHVFRGLSGMFIVDDEQSAALDLPHEYGVDDLPVIVQDRSFDSHNQFVGDGKQAGSEVLVNGTLDPYVDVTHERVRLRLLNGSGGLVYNFGFDDGRPFQLIGTDGGLLTAPVTLDRVPLTPGERAEIVVELVPGDHPVLQSIPPGVSGVADPDGGAPGTIDVLQLRAAPELVASPAVPDRLVAIDRLDPAESVATRTFHLSATQINGQNMAIDRIDATVAPDSLEIWEVTNEAGEHNFHIHGVQFQVLDIDGAPPPPELGGWKDTVSVPTGSTTRLIVRFGPYSDPDVPFMYHCHKLRHEDLGMMGQFLVVANGEAPTADRPEAAHQH